MKGSGHSNFQRTAIITAGGFGNRMKSKVPKQFLLLDGTPVLMHTIKAFYSFDNSMELLVTLPEDWWSYWKDLCDKHNFAIPVKLVKGGKERFHSIQKAVEIANGEVIAVHDGVRPLVNNEMLKRIFELAEKDGSAVPVIPLKDSIRKGTFKENNAVPRSEYYLVQTPQCFKSGWIKEAYKESEFSQEITDDATLIEKFSHKISLTEGSEENFKITTPLDLKIAELLLEKED